MIPEAIRNRTPKGAELKITCVRSRAGTAEEKTETVVKLGFLLIRRSRWTNIVVLVAREPVDRPQKISRSSTLKHPVPQPGKVIREKPVDTKGAD